MIAVTSGNCYRAASGCPAGNADGGHRTASMASQGCAVGGTPRKGRHARSHALAAGSSHVAPSSQDSTSRHTAVGPASAAAAAAAAAKGMPANIDPLTLDPDEAFARLSVREVQTIEANLRSSYEDMTGRLRTLVSERYRDMLGTANTLIDLSASSGRLVQRLEAVLRGVDEAGAASTSDDGVQSTLPNHDAQINRGDASDSHGWPFQHKRDGMAEELMRSQEKAMAELSSLVAVTKLIVEAPDEVWRALDAASQAQERQEATQAGRIEPFSGRTAREVAAAHTLRAAWIYALACAAWNWLSDAAQDGEMSHETLALRGSDATSLFIYVGKQRAALDSMHVELSHLACSGLAGWYSNSEAPETVKWQEVSSSYLSTSASLLSLELLNSCDLTQMRAKLLDSRDQALSSCLQRSALREADPLSAVNLFSHLVRFVGDTLTQASCAFVRQSEEIADKGRRRCQTLRSLLNCLSGAEQETEAPSRDVSSFPPTAEDVLETFPSATLLVSNLPKAVLGSTVSSHSCGGEPSQEDTLATLKMWSASVLSEGNSTFLKTIASKLTSIDAVGEAQMAVWASLNRAIEASHVNLYGDRESLRLVEREVIDLADNLNSVLVAQITALCRSSCEELSSTVAQAIQTGIRKKSNSAKGDTPPQEPLNFIFDATTSVKTPSGLIERLHLHTSGVQTVLYIAESSSRTLSHEMLAYSSKVRHFQARRAKKIRSHSTISTGVSSESEASAATAKMGDVAAFDVDRQYQNSMEHAKGSIIDELQKAADDVQQAWTKGDTRDRPDPASLLFVAQTAAALSYNTLFSAPQLKGSKGSLVEKLKALERRLLEEWADFVVRNAGDVLSGTNAQTAQVNVDDTSLAPSATFVEALSVLVRGYHQAGCGYRSGALWLRKRLVAGFASIWAAPSTDNSTSLGHVLQRYVEAKLLSSLLDARADSEELTQTSDRDDPTQAIKYTLDSLYDELAGQLGKDSAKEYRRDDAATLSLGRVRLLVASLAVDEPRFLFNATSSTPPFYATVNSGTTKGSGASSAFSATGPVFSSSTGITSLPPFEPIRPQKPVKALLA